MADTCLDEFTDHGHCGVIEHGAVANDATLPLLARALEFGGAPPTALASLLEIGRGMREAEYAARVVPVLARLSFGKAVRLLEKEKDFSLVLWTDKESGAEIQGWVFSRYLGKFK